MTWEEQKAIVHELAGKLAALDARGRRLFAAAAADHVLAPFVSAGEWPEWVAALRHAIAVSRSFARGDASDEMLHQAWTDARRVEEEAWDYERRANEGELFVQAFAYAAKVAVFAASRAEGPIDARMWGFEDEDESDVDAPDDVVREDLSVVASCFAVQSASTLAWYRAIEATNFTVAYYDVGEASVRGELSELRWQLGA